MSVERSNLRPGQTLAQYKILSLLGEGGMGQVYLAQDLNLNRNVSLKFLTIGFIEDKERLRRFEQEARAISALNHPNILTIHEIGRVDGHLFIVLEFIEGWTLRERLSAGLDIDDVLDIALQVASALVAAHRANIVHRDIKPQNIMIRKEDGLVKVLDFGLAKVTDPTSTAADSRDETKLIETKLIETTSPGVVMGSPLYMSPEQARGEMVDARTDIWSLGVVIYEMISGCSPFRAATTGGILAAILSKQPVPPLARYSPMVPERLEEIVEKTLAKNPEERYQTSKDLLIDLKRLKQSRELKAGIERSWSQEKLERPSSGRISIEISPPENSALKPGDLVNYVKTRKPAAIVMLALLLVLAAGAAYMRRFRATAAPSQPEIKSLAVLPLKSLDAGENDLGLGIADAVILRIAQTGKLIVRPTSAVRPYLSENTDGLTAGKQLAVDSVLEGTVQRANDRLRVSVNLLRTSDGSSLWSDTFDLHADDIFAIEDTISQQVASRLQLKLDAEQRARLRKRYTSNPEAYEHYLRGLSDFEHISISIGDRVAIDSAIAHFNQAVELDPKYALAYAELGAAYMWMVNFNDPENDDWVGLAQKSLSQAEALDPTLAEIHAARFEYYFSKYGNWDLMQAAREGRQALALNPSVGHIAVGTIYGHLGLNEEAGLREYQRALEIDPTNPVVQQHLIDSYELYGKFDEAIEAEQRFFGTVGPPFSLMAQGRLDEAQPLLEEAVKKNSGDLRARSSLALLLALRGKSAEAESAIPAIVD